MKKEEIVEVLQSFVIKGHNFKPVINASNYNLQIIAERMLKTEQKNDNRTDRQKALEWWRTFDHQGRVNLVMANFPNTKPEEINAVILSSSKIQIMWKNSQSK